MFMKRSLDFKQGHGYWAIFYCLVDSLALVSQPVYEKENTEFKPALPG